MALNGPPAQVTALYEAVSSLTTAANALVNDSANWAAQQLRTKRSDICGQGLGGEQLTAIPTSASIAMP
ncbi:MAG: hypothetical protein R2932_39520 [Caldilineaceae bacterium]